MDIIKRNFFRLLRSGSLKEYESLEPMSAFKWNRLFEMIKAQGVTSIAVKGLKNHKFDKNANIPEDLRGSLSESVQSEVSEEHDLPQLSNSFLNKRLKSIQANERHQIDASMTTLDLLNILVKNINQILNKGISLSGISELGRFLRTRGDKVDFVKLENWLQSLHIQRMAQLQGSILISVFKFDKDEVPFVTTVEPETDDLILRTLNHTELDTAKEWHFRQSSTGFVQNNSAVLRRNLRRSMRYWNYAPLETTSNFVNNFAKSLSEIEE